MSNFTRDFSECIDDIDSAMLEINEIRKKPNMTDSDRSRIDLDRTKILRSFEMLERLDAKKVMMEQTTNNVLHELESEFKLLNAKFLRLQSFERQMNEHFANLEKIKIDLFEKLEKNNLNQGFIDGTRESMNFLAKISQEDRKETFDVADELKKTEKIIDQLKKYMEK